jgi:hypothetical protein
MSDSGQRAIVVAAGLAALGALVGSVLDGPPRSLPDAALGWAPILYLERATLVALVVIGLGGIASGLVAGGRVRSLGGGALPGIDVGDAPASALTLLDGLRADVADLSERIAAIERGFHALEAGRAEE